MDCPSQLRRSSILSKLKRVEKIPGHERSGAGGGTDQSAIGLMELPSRALEEPEQEYLQAIV